MFSRSRVGPVSGGVCCNYRSRVYACINSHSPEWNIPSTPYSTMCDIPCAILNQLTSVGVFGTLISFIPSNLLRYSATALAAIISVFYMLRPLLPSAGIAALETTINHTNDLLRFARREGIENPWSLLDVEVRIDECACCCTFQKSSNPIF